MSEAFLRTTAVFAVGCCATGAGAVVSPLAAPAIGFATVIGATGLAALFKDKPDCEKAADQVWREVGKAFALGQDADPPAVRGAEKALAAALERDGLFTTAKLSEALGQEARVAEALTALTLDGVAIRDSSFAEPGLRRDFASDILKQIFAKALVACSAFQGRAILTLAEITLTEVREIAGDAKAIRSDMAEIKALMMAHIGAQGLAEVQAAGLNEAQVIELLEAFALENIPLEQAKDRLLRAAEEFAALKARLLRLTNDDPAIRDLKVQAAAAISLGELDHARELVLSAAEEHRRAGAELADALELHRLSEAEALAEVATLEGVRAKYLEAAKFYGEAAGLISAYNEQLSLVYRIGEAGALVQYAKMSPSALSLGQAIAVLEGSVVGGVDQKQDIIIWQRVLSLLATAQAMLAEMSGGGDYLELLEKSIGTSERLLGSIDPSMDPSGWCTVANTLGNAILTSGERGGETFEATMTRAIDIFREAVRICPRQASDRLWEGSRANLANGLHSLAMRRSDDTSLGLLAEAQAFAELATDLPRETTSPEQWVSGRVNLALICKSRARFDADNSFFLLQKAMRALLDATDDQAKSSVPRLWAHGKYTLAATYVSMSWLSLDVDEVRRLISMANSAYEEALEVTTPSSSPQDWAMISENACIAQATLAARTRDPALAAQVAQRMGRVIEVFEAIGSPFHLEKAIKNRENFLGLCRELGGDC